MKKRMDVREMEKYEWCFLRVRKTDERRKVFARTMERV